ncbi:MAG: NHLP bacteriocin system secretion protein [Salibacteraceae bacterium]
MKSNLFRKDAIDKLQSPDRLNEMVRVISPNNWIAALSIAVLFTFIIIWSVFGKLPINVSGDGILLKSGGVMEIPAIANGQVSEIMVKPGILVSKGEVLAKVAQPELQLKIDHMEQQLFHLKSKYNTIKGYDERDLELKKQLLNQNAENKRNRIEKNIERISFVETQIKAREELLDKGLITTETLNQTKIMKFELEQQNLVLMNELEELQLSIFEMSKEIEIELNNLDGQIMNLQGELGELQARYALNSEIKSPYTGKVVELMVNAGSIVSPGTFLLSMERADLNEEIEAIVYVNAREGKKVKVGMDVNLSPSTVEVEKFGYIKGTVIQVSDYPTTFEGMLNTLQNKQLVESFFDGLPPIAVRISLKTDNNISGYKWTSGEGPDVEIKSGTLCNSKIIVKNKRPISLVLPLVD